MMRKPKYGKIVIVVFTTILIWIWSDLALDEELPVSNVKIRVVESNPELWVSFDDASFVTIEEMVLKGPLRKINEMRRKLEEERLEIDFDATKEKLIEPGSYPLPLLPFLLKDEEIRRLGLKVEKCKPETLSVKVVGLVSRMLDVKCVDEDGNPIGGATVEPAQVDMLVPEDWGSEKRVAEVMLTPREIEQARISPHDERPYIRLVVGQIREASKPVKITMPPEPDRLTNYTVTTTTLSYALSRTLLGEYNVEVTNLNEVLSPIAIKATPDAKRAYEMQSLPLRTLYILDEDKDNPGEPKREIDYNFPEEFVRKGEIKLNQQPVIARFKLVPISSAETSKGSPG
ncbi:MAG: hypothetical protein ACYS32_18350 [Planctomycetota bacterium]|jgi:hypothetical protein